MHNTTQQISELFLAAGGAHHHAFSATNGDDPEWALWYAKYLQEGLSRLLDVKLTRSEITYWLIKLDKAYRAADRSEDWPVWYALQLQEAYDG